MLATDIAEASLTVAGVRAVVDAGLARRPTHDSATGLARLATARASRAAVDQRRGRAGDDAFSSLEWIVQHALVHGHALQ